MIYYYISLLTESVLFHTTKSFKWILSYLSHLAMIIFHFCWLHRSHRWEIKSNPPRFFFLDECKVCGEESSHTWASTPHGFRVFKRDREAQSKLKYQPDSATGRFFSTHFNLLLIVRVRLHLNIKSSSQHLFVLVLSERFATRKVWSTLTQKLLNISQTSSTCKYF